MDEKEKKQINNDRNKEYERNVNKQHKNSTHDGKYLLDQDYIMDVM